MSDYVVFFLIGVMMGIGFLAFIMSVIPSSPLVISDRVLRECERTHPRCVLTAEPTK